MIPFEEQLTGGHPNSLGNTIAVVETTLADHSRFDELFQCYFSEDEVVRLRVSNAIKRICKEEKGLLLPYLDRLLTEIAAIDQASTQWTLSQLFEMLESDLTSKQRSQAQEIMQYNLANHKDWIVLNQTMMTLTDWAIDDPGLTKWLRPHLERLQKDERKSVKKTASKMLLRLGVKD